MEEVEVKEHGHRKIKKKVKKELTQKLAVKKENVNLNLSHRFKSLWGQTYFT